MDWWLDLYLRNSLPQWLKNLPWRRMEVLAFSVYMPNVSSVILPYKSLRSYALLSIIPDLILIVKTREEFWDKFFYEQTDNILSRGYNQPMRPPCSVDV